MAQELVTAANLVMQVLEKHGPSIVPHLMDNDENAGEQLRAAISKARDAGLEVPA